LRTAYSKLAFDTLSRLTIIHPSRRDGGIMKNYIDNDEEGSIIVGSENVLAGCLDTLMEI